LYWEKEIEQDIINLFIPDPREDLSSPLTGADNSGTGKLHLRRSSAGYESLWKEDIMRLRVCGLCLSLIVMFLLSLSSAQAQKKVDLVGRDTLNFTLPSTHDRTINYAEEYYGKHHLVITFFPAAYTPV
jgi:hypothetical protein